MSKKDSLVKHVSKVLCYTASSEYIDWCPFCENKGCKSEFSDAFLKEAEAVVDNLIDSGVIRKGKLLV